ncbi:mitochondrial large subunit ribosomal protein-domain-containing protein [Xylaria telfairii]|nr:mitochondrial large subunit ribosomal protein-domain-containing protein [Xylaria telfairii]
MLPRSIQPLAAWATSLATTPIRFNTSLGLHCARTLATTAVRTSEPSTISTPAEPNAPPQLPYFVGRNNLNNLSVYHEKKRGGNLKRTVLKKGEGDLQALKQDLRDVLQLQHGDISVNTVTRHIIIRGHKRDEVLHFLYTVGF